MDKTMIFLRQGTVLAFSISLNFDFTYISKDCVKIAVNSSCSERYEH